jgi:hypothetical protein
VTGTLRLSDVLAYARLMESGGQLTPST